MPSRGCTTAVLALTSVAMMSLFGSGVATQDKTLRENNLPNPYETIRDWGTLPHGRKWGSTNSVHLDRDGTSLWVAERCSTQSWQSVEPSSCAGSNLPSVLKFDASGRLVRSFGAGVLIFPHGLHVDRDGNVWVADGRAATKEELEKFPEARGKGVQVIKFNAEGKVLLTLGKAGVRGNPPEAFEYPTDVITAPNGDVFVSDGHNQNPNSPPNTVARIVKFSKDGTFMMTWGKFGSGPGELMCPHGLALDSRGRLFVADRGNNRIQIFDQDGKFLDAWKQFGRPSDLAIDSTDTLYATDSESGEPRGRNPGWRRGIRIGSVRDGKVRYFIPPHETDIPEGAAGDGVTVDAKGNVYAAEVGTDGGPEVVVGLTKYIPRFQLFR